VNPGVERLAIEFITEAVGATPTVTYKVQGTLADGAISDANAGWVDVPYVTDATDTLSQATRSMTATGSQVAWLSNAQGRFFRRLRLVTSANTNVTYRALVHQQLK
jgi:hypothetical protein